MGQSSHHRKAFLARHPRCAFCGGKEPATTIEHCPPRALFLHKQWPEGFEFPACHSCNEGTGDEDAVVALLARTSTSTGRDDEDGRFLGLLKNVNTQFPGLVSKMLPSPAEARRQNRRLGLTPKPGQTHQDVSAIKVPDEAQAAVRLFATKLGKAIYYKQTGFIFPTAGCIIMRWFTSANVLQDGTFKLFESLSQLSGKSPLLQRNGKLLNDQFQYKVSIGEANEFFVLQAMFNSAFGFALIASPVPGKLEGFYVELTNKHGHDGHFAVLQSPTLPPPEA